MSCAMQTYTIREAISQDLPAINQLFNEAVAGDLLDWDIPQTIDFHEDWFAKMKGYPLLVAENSENKILAYGALQPQGNDEGSCCLLNTNLLIITSAPYRRKGIAADIWRALCTNQLTYERQVYLVVYTVLSNNEAGINFARTIRLDLAGQLDKLAVKSDEFVHQLTFTTFLGASPSMQGLCYPPADLFTLAPTPESQEIHLDSPAFAIRDANVGDLPFLVDLYNESILNSTALEYWLPKTVEERRPWLQRLLDERYPCLIAEEEGTPLGYIALTPYNTHPDQCYTYSASIAAHVRKNLKRKRVGETLFITLLQHRYLKEGRIFTVVADVNDENGPSIAGRRLSSCALKAGFRQAFAIPRSMVRFGQASGGIWLQRAFGPEQDLRQLALERSRWHNDIRQIEL